MLAPACVNAWGPEAIVNAKFARALIRRGHIVDVISAEYDSRKYYYPPVQEALTDPLAGRCEAIKTPRGHGFESVI